MSHFVNVHLLVMAIYVTVHPKFSSGRYFMKACILFSLCRYFLHDTAGIYLNRLGCPHRHPVYLAFFVWFILGGWSLLPVPVCTIPGLCVTPGNYTPWIVQVLPSSAFSKHLDLNIPSHNNLSSATWSVCSVEAEILVYGKHTALLSL